jgi:CYTH domain-containing protein
MTDSTSDHFADRASTKGCCEIERVWVLRAMPSIPAGAEIWRIEQGYLAPVVAGEAELAKLGFPEGRIRRVIEPSDTERFFHTVKRGAGVVREEIEREITRAEFDAAWPRTLGRRIAKTRHRVREGELVWEIDEFRGVEIDGRALVMVEVELSNATQRVELPPWLAPLVVREVSEDPSYRNSALAS